MRAQSGACAPDFREAHNPEPITQKPAWKRRVCMPAEAGKIDLWQDRSSPTSPIFASPDSCHGRSALRARRFRAGCAAARRQNLPKFTLDPLTSSPGRRPSGARLYHRDSIFAEPARCRLDRAHVWRLLAHAEALERDTREPGKHGGCLKRNGLGALRALLRQFYSYREGTCFPSYEAIARAAGCCVETVRKAIRRLEAAGILSTLRRKVVTSFISQKHRVRFDIAVQTSNSYTFNVPSGVQMPAQPAPAPQQKPRQTAPSEADAKFRRETSNQEKSKVTPPIPNLIHPRLMPTEGPEPDLQAAKARWTAALLGVT